MTTIEETLRRSLHARADRTAYHPTSVLDVARRARELRRKRTSTALLAAAAVAAAVGVPAGVVLGLGNDPEPAPAPAGPANEQAVTIDSLAGLPTGAPPAVDYLIDRTYVFAGGGRVTLDVDPGSVRDAAPYPAGVVVTANTSPAGIADHLYFGEDGELEYRGCGGETLALSGNGDLAAYVNPGEGCDRWRRPLLSWGPTAEQDADRGLTEIVVETAHGQGVEPVGVSADRALYNLTDPDSGASLGVYATTELGPPVEVPGIASASAWDPATGRVAGCPSEGRCVIVDEQDATVQLTLDPDEEPLSFSPDGRYLATVTGQGERSTAVTVRDSRSGDVVVALAGDDAAFQGDESAVAWEGSRHLLIGRVDAAGEALVRLGIDGSTSLATPVAEPTIGGYVLPGA